MSITRFNENIAYFTYDKEVERPYKDLSDLYDEGGEDTVYRVLGLYINEGKFGEQGSAVLETIQVNLPMHTTEMIKEIRADEKLVCDINSGIVGFTIYEYIPKNYPDIKAYSIRWVEIEPIDDIEVSKEDIPF